MRGVALRYRALRSMEKNRPIGRIMADLGTREVSEEGRHRRRSYF